MKDLDPLVFLAVFQEMLGPLLWLMLFVIIAGSRKDASTRGVWSVPKSPA